MDQQARSVLTWAIENLEAGLLDDPMSLIDRVETFTQEESAALNVLAQGSNEVFRRVSKAIYGDNVLTPSLTNKGWKIWSALPVTSIENEALLSAVFRYRGCVESATRSFSRGLEPRMNTDLATLKQAIGSFAQIQVCIRQFVDDLRAVVERTH